MIDIQNRQKKTGTGAYVSVEELLRLRYLAPELTLETRKKSTWIMEGDSSTRFRGRGMEFAEVRPYQPGDDIRTIDWRVTARTQTTYTKLFQEEKERPVFLVVDQRSPMFFGSHNVFKSVYAAQLASIIGWTAQHNNDRVGALLFSDHEQKDLRPKRGKHAVLALLHQLHRFSGELKSPVPEPGGTTMMEMLMDVRRIARPGSAVYILSDFHDISGECEEALSLLSRHTDVMVLNIYDTLERELSSLLAAARQFSLTDSVSRVTLHGNSKTVASKHADIFNQRQALLRRLCITNGAKIATLNVAVPIEHAARDIFISRKRKKFVRKSA